MAALVISARLPVAKIFQLTAHKANEQRRRPKISQKILGPLPKKRPKCPLLLVGARGFEPPTPSTPCWCATRLRYAPSAQRSRIMPPHPLVVKKYGRLKKRRAGIRPALRGATVKAYFFLAALFSFGQLFRSCAILWHWPHFGNLSCIEPCGRPWQSLQFGTVLCLLA